VYFILHTQDCLCSAWCRTALTGSILKWRHEHRVQGPGRRYHSGQIDDFQSSAESVKRCSFSGVTRKQYFRRLLVRMNDIGCASYISKLYSYAGTVSFLNDAPLGILIILLQATTVEQIVVINRSYWLYVQAISSSVLSFSRLHDSMRFDHLVTFNVTSIQNMQGHLVSLEGNRLSRLWTTALNWPCCTYGMHRIGNWSIDATARHWTPARADWLIGCLSTQKYPFVPNAGEGNRLHRQCILPYVTR